LTGNRGFFESIRVLEASSHDASARTLPNGHMPRGSLAAQDIKRGRHLLPGYLTMQTRLCQGLQKPDLSFQLS